MTGYFEHPDLTAKRLADGWLRTGDLTSMDAGGRFWLRGRLPDVIKNLYRDLICSMELEGILRRHDAVADVGACGFMDAMGEERPPAVVVAAQSADIDRPARGLRRLVSEHLGPPMVSEIFRFRSALPRGGNGKAPRADLRDLFERRRP